MKGPNHKQQACPSCSANVDSASAVDESGSTPEEGDISVCIYCGTALVFMGDGGLRVAKTEDIPEDLHKEIKKVQTLILDSLDGLNKGDKLN